MKRKGFILWKSCWHFCSCQRWRRLFSDSRADGGSHGIYGPAEAGSERSRFAADFMIEKIRNNLRESAAQMSGNVYRYEAYIWVKDGKDKKKKYGLLTAFS